MEKDIYFKDYLASRVIMDGKIIAGYDKVYYQINEDINDVLLGEDFTDKDVLSVLASADQYFMFKALDAKKVDSFDFNRLTMYYYFLRKWSIKYNNDVYPDIFYDDFYVENLLEKVEVSSDLEKKALDFFKRHVSNRSDFSKLFYDVDAQPYGNTLFQNVRQLKKIVDSDFTFYNMDLFRNNRDLITKKYDYLYISNILDWAREDSSKITIAKDNLLSLLKDNGKVICSRLVNRSKSKREGLITYLENKHKKNKVGWKCTYYKYNGEPCIVKLSDTDIDSITKER